MLSLPLVFVLYALSVIGNGQQIHDGKCKQFSTQSDFDVAKYTGTWYDIEKFFFVGQMDKRCTEANYYLRDDGRIDVINRDINKEGHYENRTGIAYYTDPSDKSKLTVQLGTDPKVGYWIVDTDYDKYSLVWSCYQIKPNQAAELCWILSRERTLDQSTINMLKEKLDSLGIATDGFFKTNQTNCD